MQVAVKKSGLEKLQAGIPYLEKEDFFEVLPKDGTLLEIESGTNETYYGYVGREHRSSVGIVDAPLNADSIKKYLQEALQKRINIFRELPEAYRLFHNEADGIPGFAVEIFKEWAVVSYFNQGIMHFEAVIIKALNELLNLKGIYAKYRTPQIVKVETQLIEGEAAPENLVIKEQTGSYIVKLADGLMTGLFLDQRANRQWLAKVSKGKTVCNTFSYTGALSIACALGGATQTTSVDLSARYNTWCEENIALNGLDINNHVTITTDTFAHFDFCKRNNLKYDIIILDPPTFAKKKGGSFSVAEDYEKLVRLAIPLLNPHGILASATNYSQWNFQDFHDLVEASIQKIGYQMQEICHAQADRDFPVHPHWLESNHLKFMGIQLI